MEEDIDLSSYIEVLLRHWKWIVGLALAAGVVAFIVSSLLPRTYEASAVVLVTEPRYEIKFDPRFGTEESTPAYKAFPTLATSDSVLQAVVDAHNAAPGSAANEWTLTSISGMVEATSAGDPSLLVLKARSQSAQETSSIANLWAEVLVERGNELYTGTERDVAFFEKQLMQAEEALEKTETDLISFQAENLGNVIQAQLDSQNQAQADYLTSQRTISYIVQDIQGLRHQLANQSGNQDASAADSLTALLLQIKAFNAQASDTEVIPIQLQIDSSASLLDRSVSEQIGLLDGLVASLQTKSAEIDEELAGLEPQILASQQKLQELTVELDRLARTQELTRETYLTLARKKDEANIAAQEETGMLQVGSFAAVPEKPAGPRRLVNTLVGAGLGFLIGLTVVVLSEVVGGSRQMAGDEDSGDES